MIHLHLAKNYDRIVGSTINTGEERALVAVCLLIQGICFGDRGFHKHQQNDRHR